MRPLKFRAWHSGMKRIISPEEMAVDQLTILPSTGQFINVSGDNTRRSTIYPIDKFIPMQFSGLLDRNGKEIYEGDIVKWWHLWPGENCSKYNLPATEESLKWLAEQRNPWGHTSSVVAFDDGKFTWAGKSWFKTWRMDDNFFVGGQICEVIGNIHENPDLLTRTPKEN